MAEALINQLCGDHYEAQSAGIEPGKLNPIVAEVMAEIGIDVSGHQPRAVAEMIQSGQAFRYAITVCDETSAERYPIFPGKTERLHWGFADPPALHGSHEQKLAATRTIRDQIKNKIDNVFCPVQCV